jgi:hypothetical protein
LATKIALCVGQNKYDPSTGVTPLRGCVNDTLLIGEMLRRAGFQVRQVHDQAATQRGILNRLSTEIAKLRQGDYLVFWNSSHGYQLNDREGVTERVMNSTIISMRPYAPTTLTPGIPSQTTRLAGLSTRLTPRPPSFWALTLVTAAP